MSAKASIRIGAMLLSAVFLLNVLICSAGASTPPGSDENGYVSMHSYVSKTDQPDIYKVTQTIQGDFESPPLLITFVLDHSISMWDSSSLLTDGNRKYQAMADGLNAALNVLMDSVKNQQADRTYVNIVVYGGDLVTNVPVAEQLGLSGSRISSWSITDRYVAATDSFTTTQSNGDFLPLLDGGVLNPLISGAVNKMVTTMAANVPAGNNAPNGMKTGTFIGAGERQAYRNLANAKATNSPSSAFYTFDEYPKYIMVMTDGSDQQAEFATYTQTYGLALRLPTDYDINPYNGIEAALPGMNAKIWSITIDNVASSGTPAQPQHSTDWEKVFFNWDSRYSSINGVPRNANTPDLVAWPYQAVTGGGNVWGFFLGGDPTTHGVNPRRAGDIAMSAIAAPLDLDQVQIGFGGKSINANYQYIEDYILNFFYNYAESTALAAPYPTTSQGYTYNTRKLNAGTSHDETSFFFAPTAADTSAVFQNFASSAVLGFTGALRGRTALSSAYNLYQMPGEPLLNLSASDGSDAGTVSATGKGIEWKLKEMKSGVLYSLVYYVKMESGLDASLSYPVFDSSDFSFSIGGSDYVKMFPIPYISPTGEIGEVLGGESGGSAGTGTGGSGGENENGNMTPLFAIPYGNTTPYTPSVIPKALVSAEGNLQEKQPDRIENESVMEGTKEVQVADTATQGEIGWIIPAIVLALAASTAGVFWRHRMPK